MAVLLEVVFRHRGNRRRIKIASVSAFFLATKACGGNPVKSRLLTPKDFSTEWQTSERAHARHREQGERRHWQRQRRSIGLQAGLNST
jgi:hypothetical protein